ncbi:AzlD domain-containing protein [Erwinia psidii]|uniref:AzlD domain-containing protein n=1 Tax=Erwinia psidii TaxID=69224 RepID=A0A3N6SCW4_9GAMM|nr:AzlD domain-containing protein [Erwinia psidii]MCX8959535.1 AzlD domain-containing protein [Erwinia psidii]MCX8963212.1 AzlD domain-containing protein [Erwinia psidii]MCX8967001.1 AzlD domain-containing protein [Erwinia psidii]RQM36431.1 AzlD domain-containing protein [Erwinia psidii]
MTMPYDEGWMAVIAMGVVTWLLRSLPFMLNKRVRADDNRADHGSPVFAALGPSLLAAIMIVTLIPGMQQAMSIGYGRTLCYVAGILMTLGALRVTKNPGIAVIVGVGIYGMGLWFLVP